MMKQQTIPISSVTEQDKQTLSGISRLLSGWPETQDGVVPNVEKALRKELSERLNQLSKVFRPWSQELSKLVVSHEMKTTKGEDGSSRTRTIYKVSL